MSFVRTVLGDIAPHEMGLTYSHEHVVIEESFPTLANPDFVLNDTERITIELKEFYELGGRTLVDTMPANCGRNVLKLATVSRNSNVNIIAPTGIHLEKYYLPDHWRYSLSADELTTLFVKDITEGIDEFDYGCPIVKRTSHKAGLIKLATDINHVVLSHVDKNKNLGYHKELMHTGVYVEYDSHFRWKTTEDNWTYILLEKLLPAHSNRIVIEMDMARNTYWKSYGGKPGLIFLLTTFKDELNRRGLINYFDQMFY